MPKRPVTVTTTLTLEAKKTLEFISGLKGSRQGDILTEAIQLYAQNVLTEAQRAAIEEMVRHAVAEQDATQAVNKSHVQDNASVALE